MPRGSHKNAEISKILDTHKTCNFICVIIVIVMVHSLRQIISLTGQIKNILWGYCEVLLQFHKPNYILNGVGQADILLVTGLSGNPVKIRAERVIRNQLFHSQIQGDLAYIWAHIIKLNGSHIL